jgi:hypothetical protein
MINFLYSGMQPGIDHGAHAYGFLGGAIFTFLFGPRLFFRSSPPSGVGYGTRRVVDRPLINYLPLWRRFKQELIRDEEDGLTGVHSRDNGGRGGGRFNPRRGELFP